MDFISFSTSLSQSQPNSDWPPLIQALWFDAKGDWTSAHNIADGFGTQEGDWVHAYLHRKEGDIWNADYWYRQAGRVSPNVSLAKEWEDICTELLQS